MVIVKLREGLGNQLFQYAVARQIAYRNQVPLKLDISAFARNQLRTYQLDHFNISGEIAIPNHMPWAKQANLRGKAARWLERFRPYYRRSWLVEQQWFRFDANILRAPRHVYLQGFWQSEKYFKAIEPIIRTEFTLKEKLAAANQAISEQIARVNSVSLHVRRGDYIADPQIHQLFGVCSLDYYAAAVQKVSTFLPDPHFFVFSDDPAWVQKNVKLAHPMTLIDHNGPQQDYEDLQLMSLCQHHIIANSSFSWWGAWLNPNPNKVVLAPRSWLKGGRWATPDLLPESWIKL